jgi:selT/selW/selH-like putative selenoprotein
LATELKRRLGIESTLIAGGGGVFDVTADGKLIFSKKKEKRFPEVQEILGALPK